jgi:hypothetical protein
LSLGQNPEACAFSKCGPAEEFRGGEALLAFELNFKELQPGVFSAGDEEAVVFDVDLSGLREN